MPTTPALNGQLIGQAERATRAVLDRLLARTGTGFTEWVALNLATSNAAPIAPEILAARLAHGLKTSVADALVAIAALRDGGLVHDLPDGTLAPSRAGRERYEEISSGIAAVSARLYGDLPLAEVAAAGRVLATVTERANALLTEG